MALRDQIRRFADVLGLPAFSGTPYPSGQVDVKKELTIEQGGSGTYNFGGFIRGEDFNPDMDGLTAIKNLDIMRRSDAQTNASLSVIMQPVRSADKSVDAAKDAVGNSTELDLQVAKFVEWNLFGGDTIMWDDFLRQALLMLVFGHYVFEKVWALQKQGEWSGKLYYRKLAPRPPKTIWQWFIDESGELLSIKQLAVKAGTYQFLDIPASKLVVFVYNKEGDNYAGMSILRSAYPHWMIKNNLYIIDAVRAVRFGAGIPKAKLQKGYAPTAADKQSLINTLSGMSSHQFSYIIEPENVDISIMTPEGTQGGAQVMPTIEHHNQQITRNVLATFLDMGGKEMGGSNALGSSAMDFFTNAVVSLGDLIEDVVDKQIIRPLVDANFDVNQLSGYPTLRFSGIKKDNLKDLAGIVTSLSTAGMAFVDLETQNTFRNLLGLPEVTEADIQAAGPQSPLPDGDTPPAEDGSPSAPPAVGGKKQLAVPRTQPTNKMPQGMRPARPVGAAAANKTSTAVDRSQKSRDQNIGSRPAVARIASSGDADEEEHTITRKGVITKETRLSDQASTFWRTPTELESRVLDLSEIPRRLDTARDALHATLLNVREEQALRIAELVAHLPDGTTLPKPPLMGKLSSDVWKILEGVFEYGYGQVGRELQKQGAPAEAGPAELTFADSCDMPFPVELSPFPEPTRDVVDEAPVLRLELESLVASQASLTVRRVLPKSIDTSLPIVVQHNGLKYIYDGHHRLADAKKNGAKLARVRYIEMSELAFAGRKTKGTAAAQLKLSIDFRLQTASEKMLASARHEALSLKKRKWTNDEIEDALKIHLGEVSEKDTKRLSKMSVNESFAAGRIAAAEGNADRIGYATLSALMDSMTCRVCRRLDGKKYKIGSDAYTEHLPPVKSCKGREHCRCVYIYSFSAKRLAEVALGGPGSGWFRHAGHVSHKHKDEKSVLKPSKEKAWSGQQDDGPRMSKLETGALGEHLAILYLKQIGHKDARSLNTKGSNYALDLVHKHQAFEVKTGLASNSSSAQQWRATIGQPGPKEKAWLAKASPEAKARWNARKADEIMKRKRAAADAVSKMLGKRIKGKTLSLIINAKTRVVDIYEFDGFHARIGWRSDQAQRGFKGSFRY